MNIEAMRSQEVRKAVLDILFGYDGTAIGAEIKLETLREGVMSAVPDLTGESLRSELNDLFDRDMLYRRHDPNLGDWLFRIAPRGRDFLHADYPWKKIDEFFSVFPFRKRR
jgi:hypothetical protein